MPAFWGAVAGGVWMRAGATGCRRGGCDCGLSRKDECEVAFAAHRIALVCDDQLYDAGCAYPAQPGFVAGGAKRVGAGQSAGGAGSHDYAEGGTTTAAGYYAATA